MDNQDFEQYADTKRIVGQVAATWESPFHEELKARGLSDYSQVKFLDFGCGDGRYFPYLTTKGFLAENIYGVEVSQKRIDRCRQLGWANARVLAIREPLPYRDGFFDVVNCVEVIEHIPRADFDFYLGEIVRVMKPGAFLILTTPNYPTLKKLAGSGRDILFYGRDVLALYMLARAGREVVYETHDIARKGPRGWAERKLIEGQNLRRIVFISNELRRAYLEKYGTALAGKKMIVAPDAADEQPNFHD